MYNHLRPLLFRVNPETAHQLVMGMLKIAPFAVRMMTPPVPRTNALSQTLWGKTFPHPVGLAAGLDKNGEAIEGLFQCGFSFLEVGTVTPKAQPGNPKPRLFRLVDDEALINRMGFNNDGVAQLCRNVTRQRRTGIVGINIGKNKVTPNEDAVNDYITCLEAAIPYADYIAVNVSSPNTPGLRDLQSEDSLVPLVTELRDLRDALLPSTSRGPNFKNAKELEKKGHEGRDNKRFVPLLVKLAPDLTDESIVSLTKSLLAAGADGFIATNTTISREGLHSAKAAETGGLSGKPLSSRANYVTSLMYNVTKGRVPIMGSGGIMSAQDAYNRILAGANLVQIYTGFIYHGPRIVYDIAQSVAAWMARDGFSSIEDAVGAAAR